MTSDIQKKQVCTHACPNHYLFSFWYLHAWESQASSQKHSELKILREIGKCSNAGNVLGFTEIEIILHAHKLFCDEKAYRHIWLYLFCDHVNG